MDPRLAHHLSSSRGLITLAQGHRLGISADRLQRMCENGDLTRVHDGVYRHVAVAETWEQRLQAALLAAGPAAVVSHRSGLSLHGVRNVACALVEITVRGRSLPLRAGVIAHRSLKLLDDDVTVVDGICVTRPARTLVDLCSVLSPKLVVRYAQEWLADRKFGLDDLDSAIARAGKRAGLVGLRAALASAGLVAEADSVPEAALGRLLTRAGMPPAHHVLVTTSGGDTFELDWAYPQQRVGLELDGYGVHLRSQRTFEHDRYRRNELEAEGWRILNFTTNQCLRNAGRIVDQVRRVRAIAAS